MKDTSYRFGLGDFECVSIVDGSVDYTLKLFFENVPVQEAEEALRQRGESADYVTTPYTYLYADTGQHRVLVDMGAGHLAPTTGKLAENMRAAGIDPLEVDVVFITHAHPDHVGGTLDERGDPVYANARYYIWKGELDFWTSEAAYAKAPQKHVDIARRNLEPIRDRLVLVEREGEVLPGITVLSTPGHTPGHTSVLLASGGERLVYTGDVVLHPLHLEHPDWLPIFDILPEQAEVSKRRLFDMAAEEQFLVLGQHFAPFPSVGRVTKEGQHWKWRPAEVRVTRLGL